VNASTLSASGTSFQPKLVAPVIPAQAGISLLLHVPRVGRIRKEKGFQLLLE
jgi:hypothetical protein